MSILAIAGFIMMIALIIILLKNILTPNVVFVILPTVAALICGFSVNQLGIFVGDGLKSILSTVTLLTFSIMFFSLMKDVGVFNVIVKYVLKLLNNNVRSVLIATIVISSICSLDGNAYATLLVTVPALLPIYDKMRISRKTLFLCIVIGVGATGVTPWGGSLLRAVAVTHADPVALYRSLIPIQVVIVILGIIVAHFMAKIETKNGAGMSDEEFREFKILHITENLVAKNESKLLPYNFILVIAAIVLLVIGLIPGHFLFMLAVAIALPLNFPQAKVAQQKIKEYGVTVMPVVITFFAIGAFLGILQGTGMINEMVMFIVSLFPESFGPHIYIAVALFSVPLVIAFGSDAFYFALLPLVAGVAGQFGVSAHNVTYALLTTEQIGLLLSPAIAATYLGLGLLGLEIGEHIKHSFGWVWGISVIALLAALIFGIIPL